MRFLGVISILGILCVMFNSLLNFKKSPLQESNWSEVVYESWLDWSKNDYRTECINLYKQLRFPNKNLFFNPALRKPPAHLLSEFTQHGQMPIKKWRYFNEVYSDSKGDQVKKQVIKKKEIENYLRMIRKNEPLIYEDKVFLIVILRINTI